MRILPHTSQEVLLGIQHIASEAGGMLTLMQPEVLMSKLHWLSGGSLGWSLQMQGKEWPSRSHSRNEQGNEYLRGTKTCFVTLLDELGDAADPTLVASAAIALEAQLQKQPATGEREGPLQQALMAVLKNMSASHAELLRQQPGDRCHALLCDRFEAAANVVSIIEAKCNLGSRSMEVQSAFQIAQRLSQLKPSQPSRRSWWVGLISAD